MGVPIVATKWDYRLIENSQQSEETKAQSMIRWIQANAGQGWEFDQVIDFGEGGNSQLLFRRLISN